MPHGNWRTTTQPIEGGYEHRFFLPEPLRRDQSYNLAFTPTPKTPEVAEYAQPRCIWEESLAFHERSAYSMELLQTKHSTPGMGEATS
jgi:hypothetical protein